MPSNDQTKDPPALSGPPPDISQIDTTQDLVSAVRRLRSYGGADRPSRHQPLLLLRAVGRARTRQPRLERWSEVQKELAKLLAKYNTRGSRPTPEYPFVALASTVFWELTQVDGEIPRAHGSEVRKWLDATNPLGGLTEQIYGIFGSDDSACDAVVNELLTRYFTDEDNFELLQTLGLPHVEQNSSSQDLRPTPAPPRAIISSIPVEAHRRETFVTNHPEGDTPASRREASLVERYVLAMNKHGHKFTRQRIDVSDDSHPLYTDLYDENLRELIEAKGDGSRESIRMALGQLLDYSRYVNHESLAVLLPIKPAEDLATLLGRNEVRCIYEIAPGRFDQYSRPMLSPTVESRDRRHNVQDPAIRGKLVRDKVPDVIRNSRSEPITIRVRPQDFRHLLRSKLQEEVEEFLSSHSLVELADILEVIFALADDLGFDRDELEDQRVAKQRSRGAFTQRLVWFGNKPAR